MYPTFGAFPPGAAPAPLPAPLPVPAPNPAPGPFPNSACDFGLPFVCSVGQEAAFNGVTSMSFGGPSRACYFKDGCAVVPEGVCALGAGTFFANASTCHPASTPAPGSAGLAAMAAPPAPSPVVAPTSWSGFGVGGCGLYGNATAAGCAVAQAYGTDVLLGQGRPGTLPILGWMPGSAAARWAKPQAGSGASLAAVGPVAPTCPTVFQNPSGGCMSRSQVCADYAANTFENVACGNKASMTDPSPAVQTDICSGYGFGNDYTECKKWFPASS